MPSRTNTAGHNKTFYYGPLGESQGGKCFMCMADINLHPVAQCWSTVQVANHCTTEGVCGFRGLVALGVTR